MAAKQSPPPSGKPNIYTVLLVVAAVVLATGVGFMWHLNTQMTGEGDPFHLEEPIPEHR